MKKRTEFFSQTEETIIESSGVSVKITNGQVKARYQPIRNGQIQDEWSEWSSLEDILLRLTMSRGATRRWAEARARAEGFDEGITAGYTVGHMEGWDDAILHVDTAQDKGVDISKQIHYYAKGVRETRYRIEHEE